MNKLLPPCFYPRCFQDKQSTAKDSMYHKFQRTASSVHVLTCTVQFERGKEIAAFDSIERNKLDVTFSHFFPLATFG